MTRSILNRNCEKRNSLQQLLQDEPFRFGLQLPLAKLWNFFSHVDPDMHEGTTSNFKYRISSCPGAHHQQSLMAFLRSLIFMMMTLGLIDFYQYRVDSAPVQIPPFDTCKPARYTPLFPGSPPQPDTFDCCPPLPERPIVDFKAPSVKPGSVNLRRPLQCLDDTYLDKLEKAYELMRALPDDDPRSFYQQSVAHCAYCGGAFYQPGSNNSIDIHYTWLFFPWHRAFLYFHERILQNLLNDTTFTLPFWNWDQQLSGYQGADIDKYFPSSEDQCFKSANKFPEPFLESFTKNRSSLIINRRFALTNTPADTIVELANLFRNFSAPLTGPGSYNRSIAYQVASNLNLMYRNLIKQAKTTESFYGARYRVGDPQSVPNFDPPQIFGGSIEIGPHFNVHVWTGAAERPYAQSPGLWNAASDPVFYPHHSNVDRLWTVWKSLGGQDFTDPDWLNASFLFYDENKDLVRIKVCDVLSTDKLGYTYEKVVNSWISYDNAPICTQTSPSQLASIMSSLPVQLPPGGVTLDIPRPYLAVVERPSKALIKGNVEETLVIEGIRLDRNVAGQFVVFVNLPEATLRTPWNCAEFVGRFSYSPLIGGPGRDISNKNFAFKADISAILRDLEVEGSERVLISVVYSIGIGIIDRSQLPIISFNSIRITNSKQ